VSKEELNLKERLERIVCLGQNVRWKTELRDDSEMDTPMYVRDRASTQRLVPAPVVFLRFNMLQIKDVIELFVRIFRTQQSHPREVSSGSVAVEYLFT
jgi:hypothetical protein